MAIFADLEKAVEEYGSMQAYVREGLRITEQEVERLRSELLE
jgi:protein tyrosine/serine phosphatase